MPVTLENRERRMQVFNLPHDVACTGADGCACSERTLAIVERNPRTGERAPRVVTRRVPASLTLLARERRAELPTAILDVPEVRAAILAGRVRVVAQTPDAPAAVAAPEKGATP